jgi:hypothetical protein
MPERSGRHIIAAQCLREDAKRHNGKMPTRAYGLTFVDCSELD